MYIKEPNRKKRAEDNKKNGYYEKKHMTNR